MRPVHAFLGLIGILAANQLGLIEFQFMFYIYWIIGSWLPDMGKMKVTETRFGLTPLALIREIVSGLFRHHPFSHSLIAIGILFAGFAWIDSIGQWMPDGYLGWILGFIFPKGWQWAVLIAYVAHVIADGFTTEGTYLFFPRKAPLRFLPERYCITIGSFREYSISLALFATLIGGWYGISKLT